MTNYDELYEAHQLDDIYVANIEELSARDGSLEEWMDKNFVSCNSMFKYIGDDEYIPCRNCLTLFHVNDIGSSSICPDCKPNEFRR